MKGCAWIVVMVVGAGCGDDLSRPGVPPTLVPDARPSDGPIDTPPSDAGADGPADGPPSGLAEICGAEPATLEDWEDCYLKRWCENIVGCTSLNTYRSVAECIAWSDRVQGGRLSAERRERARAVAQGRASLNAAAFTQCLFDTSRAHCNTARFSVACAARYTGTVTDGGICYADAECASSGATCEASCTDACCAGTCRPRYKLGQACDDFDSCEPGLVCRGVCRSGDIGSTCASFRDCDQDAWCSGNVCTADRAPGAMCRALPECGGETTCVGLIIGNPAPGQCVRISRPGDSCDFACFGNLYCDGSGTCRELPDVGQSCSALLPCRGADTLCGGNNRCELRAAAGATCANSYQCTPGLFCTAELSDPDPRCVAKGGTGNACASPEHCESYRCSGNASQPGSCLPWSDTCP